MEFCYFWTQVRSHQSDTKSIERLETLTKYEGISPLSFSDKRYVISTRIGQGEKSLIAKVLSNFF